MSRRQRRTDDADRMLDRAEDVRLHAETVAGTDAPTVLVLACGRCAALHGLDQHAMNRLAVLLLASFGDSIGEGGT